MEVGMEIKSIATHVVDAAIKIHRKLGSWTIRICIPAVS